MPANKHLALHPSIIPSVTHSWHQPNGRRFNLQPGKTVVQWSCTACGRHFVYDSETEEWYAALPRILDFERLYAESERWLKETCSGEFKSVDEQKRNLRRII